MFFGKEDGPQDVYIDCTSTVGSGNTEVLEKKGERKSSRIRRSQDFFGSDRLSKVVQQPFLFTVSKLRCSQHQPIVRPSVFTKK
ncbi:hypothetical protein L5515_003810 [Caenorhabditis briggsae]|uniref:Uncharacterized protein n=1 Tax=Caenorhabditis briggsae TaxID=6238 RepID=A0AAE9DBB4_CAEBR|nr:hypothetical protein L3Y34_000953 [Caenorhabditis briggsae]UMM22750.1 hypothetical protein L5515_003810 [Caenorhabditis briggsae]